MIDLWHSMFLWWWTSPLPDTEDRSIRQILTDHDTRIRNLEDEKIRSYKIVEASRMVRKAAEAEPTGWFLF